MFATEGEGDLNQIRHVKINIRALQNQRDVIDHAADLQGKSRSEFMLEISYQKALEVLLDRTFFGLDDRRFQQFQAVLDAPPTSNDKLQTLLTTKSPWD